MKKFYYVCKIMLVVILSQQAKNVFGMAANLTKYKTKKIENSVTKPFAKLCLSQLEKEIGPRIFKRNLSEEQINDAKNYLNSARGLLKDKKEFDGHEISRKELQNQFKKYGIYQIYWFLQIGRRISSKKTFRHNSVNNRCSAIENLGKGSATPLVKLAFAIENEGNLPNSAEEAGEAEKLYWKYMNQ